ncbi:hypothetical protein H0A36_28240 [Endozoicomonas sp. SM1973]|uniref:Uncharacterized protein n=1 Tax=Spartinivicinus marinus TaxID=2994442 RepID=A0A853IHB8_9GAMM|nr:hypothetical protein [Spartinivicinus marinus]MCX4027848.1 hypothetical protein [Spartinivicinus marinus]NYZ69908.1 hypothetical protein [Spartinivicinus marinus]
MSFSEYQQALNQEKLALWGEPVTLPDGNTVTGIFRWQVANTEVGHIDSDQKQPTLEVFTTVTQSWPDQLILLIRNQPYTLVKCLPKNNGMTLCVLTETPDTQPNRVWQ